MMKFNTCSRAWKQKTSNKFHRKLKELGMLGQGKQNDNKKHKVTSTHMQLTSIYI